MNDRPIRVVSILRRCCYNRWQLGKQLSSLLIVATVSMPNVVRILKVSEKYVTNLVLTTLWAATVSHSPMAP